MPDFQARITWTPAAGAYGQKLRFWKDTPTTEAATGESPLGPTTSTYLLGVMAQSDYVVRIYTVNMQAQESSPLELTFTTPANLIPPPTGGSVTYEPNS